MLKKIGKGVPGFEKKVRFFLAKYPGISVERAALAAKKNVDPPFTGGGTETRRRRVNRYFVRERGLSEKGKQEAQRNLERRMWSGRHAPREGEIVVPAAGLSEPGYGRDFTGIGTPGYKSRYMYRGNPIKPGSPTAAMSRHPDVAAAYSRGQTGSQLVSPSGEVFVYRKKGLRRLGEGPADNYGPRPEGGHKRRPESLLEREMRGKARHAEWKGKPGRTYEDTVATNKKQPKHVAVLRVRQTRTSEGDPAYAFTSLEGLPAEDVIVPYTKKAHAMNPHMLAELDKIARVQDLTCFKALDKLANIQMAGGSTNAPGSTMGSYSAPPTPPVTQPSATGATAMGGMSVHCDKCFAEIKEKGVTKCPHCGKKIKAIRDIESAPREKQIPRDGDDHGADAYGDTGGEAAVNEELAEGAYGDSGKYAAAAKLTAIQQLKASLALGGGLYGGNEVRKELKKAEQQVQQRQRMAKYSFARGSRLASLHFKPRGARPSSVHSGMKRIRRASTKYTSRVLARTGP